MNKDYYIAYFQEMIDQYTSELAPLLPVTQAVKILILETKIKTLEEVLSVLQEEQNVE